MTGSTDVLLLAVKTAAVLQALQIQVVAHIRHNLLAADHRAAQVGIAAGVDGDDVACAGRGCCCSSLVAVGMALAFAGTGGDACGKSVFAIADGQAHACAGAAVGAAVAVGILRGQQIDLVVGHQGGILACRDVAALDQDVAVFASAEESAAGALAKVLLAGCFFDRDDVDIAPGLQGCAVVRDDIAASHGDVPPCADGDGVAAQAAALRLGRCAPCPPRSVLEPSRPDDLVK